MADLNLVMIGDSLTDANAYGLMPADQYPCKVKLGLVSSAPDNRVLERNLGIAGNTSIQMLARIGGALLFGAPDIVFVLAGANDRNPTLRVNAGGGASTTVIPLVAGAGAYLAVGGYVVIGGQTRRIAAVATDTITLDSALAGAPAANASVYADTRRNIVEIALALAAGGCRRIMVIGQPYKNFTTAGDTTSAEESLNGTLRTLQQQAVADLVAAGLDAIYCDTYAYQRGLILSGNAGVAQGDNLWSVYPDNQHLSPLGHSAVAAAILAAINAAPGWRAALT